MSLKSPPTHLLSKGVPRPDWRGVCKRDGSWSTAAGFLDWRPERDWATWMDRKGAISSYFLLCYVERFFLYRREYSGLVPATALTTRMKPLEAKPEPVAYLPQILDPTEDTVPVTVDVQILYIYSNC
jgi:hypothetical protein